MGPSMSSCARSTPSRNLRWPACARLMRIRSGLPAFSWISATTDPMASACALVTAGGLNYAIEHGQKTTSPESLADADPLHLETVELGEVVHHGVLGEQLGEGVAANLDQVAVVVVSPEHLTTPT